LIIKGAGLLFLSESALGCQSACKFSADLKMSFLFRRIIAPVTTPEQGVLQYVLQNASHIAWAALFQFAKNN
jgi:hypothetical protein